MWNPESLRSVPYWWIWPFQPCFLLPWSSTHIFHLCIYIYMHIYTYVNFYLYKLTTFCNFFPYVSWLHSSQTWYLFPLIIRFCLTLAWFWRPWGIARADHLKLSFPLQCKVISLSSWWEKLLPEKEEETGSVGEEGLKGGQDTQIYLICLHSSSQLSVLFPYCC